MFSLVQDYVYSSKTSKEIKEIITQTEEPVVRIDFGKIGGVVYFIKPDINLPTAKLLNELDQQPRSRSPMAIVDNVLGGESLLGSTNPHMTELHNLFRQSLSNPADYMRFTQEELQSYLNLDPAKQSFNLKEMVAYPLRWAIARGLFGLEQPDEQFDKALDALCNANREIEEDFAAEIQKSIIATYYPSILSLIISFLAKSAKQQYSDNIKIFINKLEARILTDLHHFANNEEVSSVLSLSIIDLIKNDKNIIDEELKEYLGLITAEQLRPYLENKYIKTLPGMIVAADNLMAIMTATLRALSENDELLNELRSEILEDQLIIDNLTPQQLISNKNQGKCLHRIYLEALRLRSAAEKPEDKPFNGGVVWRYTDSERGFAGYTIEARSIIVILTTFNLYNQNIYPEPANFNPSRYQNIPSAHIHTVFSQGKRKCPASYITEFIFKTFLLELVAKYNFKLIQNPQGSYIITLEKSNLSNEVDNVKTQHMKVTC